MTTMERGMIIDIDLDPVQGSETGKVRPCVVVTNDVYNARVPVIQVVPITAWNEKKARIKTNVTLTPSETFENLTFLSFPRKRESMKPLKGLDSCFRRNDDLLIFGRNSKVSVCHQRT